MNIIDGGCGNNIEFVICAWNICCCCCCCCCWTCANIWNWDFRICEGCMLRGRSSSSLWLLLFSFDYIRRMAAVPIVCIVVQCVGLVCCSLCCALNISCGQAAIQCDCGGFRCMGIHITHSPSFDLCANRSWRQKCNQQLKFSMGE